jgi:hypothetical protein
VLDLDLLPGVSFLRRGVIDSGLEESESRAGQKTEFLSLGDTSLSLHAKLGKKLFGS